MAKILLLEDDLALLETVDGCLQSAGYEVDARVSGTDGLALLSTTRYDLVIADWDLPGMTGLEVCSRFRESGGATPYLFLTGKSQVESKEQAFDVGADDYLTKPFNVRELLLRVRALLNRPAEFVGNTLKIGELELNLKSYSVSVGDVSVSLTKQEFSLLELFMRNPKHVFSCDELMDRLWKLDADVSDESVKACVKRLRSKLRSPSFISNVRGEGYRFASLE